MYLDRELKNDPFQLGISSHHYWFTFCEYLFEILKKSNNTIKNYFFGCELEFYIKSFAKDKEGSIQKILNELRQSCDFILDIKNEIGTNQFEVVFKVCDSPVILADYVYMFQYNAKEIAKSNMSFIYFEAKPFFEEPPSSMQFSFSFYDENNTNILNYERQDWLDCIISSMLHHLPSSVKFFAPTVRCYDRFSQIECIKKYRNSPSTIS